ncbi:unnamed protein product, partial [Ectocarpus sp. 8 AP-2014]
SGRGKAEGTCSVKGTEISFLLVLSLASTNRYACHILVQKSTRFRYRDGYFEGDLDWAEGKYPWHITRATEKHTKHLCLPPPQTVKINAIFLSAIISFAAAALYFSPPLFLLCSARSNAGGQSFRIQLYTVPIHSEPTVKKFHHTRYICQTMSSVFLLFYSCQTTPHHRKQAYHPKTTPRHTKPYAIMYHSTASLA